MRKISCPGNFVMYTIYKVNTKTLHRCDECSKILNCKLKIHVWKVLKEILRGNY